MIAVDTNLIVDLFLRTPHTDVARAIARHDDQWHAPLLWRSEFASVLWQHHRSSGLPLGAARELHRRACAWMDGTEHVPSFDTVLELSFETDATPHDCQFVAVARTMGVRLLSHDRRLRRSFPDAVLDPREFLTG